LFHVKQRGGTANRLILKENFDMTYPTPPLPRFVKLLAGLATFIALMLLIALVSSTGAIGAGLNGVELGSQPTVGTLKSQLGITVDPTGRTPASGLPSASQAYSGFATIEGVSMRIVVQLDAEHRVEAISATFNPAAYYEIVEGAMLRDYGTPTTRGALQQSTRSGFTVTNVESDWILDDHSTVCLLKYLLDVDVGQLKLYTEAHSIAQRQAREATDRSHL
jgi:hypothetical protein